MNLFDLDYYILGEVITCILSLILCINVFLNFSFLGRKQRLFGYAGISSFLSAFFDICAVICITYYKSIPLYLGTLASTFYFINLIAIPFFMLWYVIEVAYSFNKRQMKQALIFVNIEYLVYICLILVNIKTGIVFRYDYELGYVRGPFKYMTYILTFIFIAESFVCIIFNRKSLPKRIFYVFLIYPFISLGFVFIQLLNNRILLSGVSSFTALLFAYLTIQSDLVEYDYITGLMTESKLHKEYNSKRPNGVIYVFAIDNLNSLQANMDLRDLDNVLLRIGNKLLEKFPGAAYRLTNNRFAIMGTSIDEIMEKVPSIENYIKELNNNQDLNLPYQIELFSAAMEFNKEKDSYNDLIDVMNIMLANAKNSNDKTLKICNESIFHDLELKKSIFRILKRELIPNSSQYQVWFQPIFSIKENKFTHCEALSRLINTEIGNISPSDFIYIAEIKGLIERLGNVVFERVCRFMAKNINVIDSISVNFSAYQMLKPDIVDKVLDTINKFGLKPSNIIIEITESIFIDDFPTVCNHMKQLNKAGVEFYLDDFGTGFSNLANVVALPFSTIKIDRTFVLMMEKNKKAKLLFKNIVNTFKDTDFRILVEGVETEEQNDFVIKTGADYIQGYLYSKPLPPDECLDFLRKN